MQIQTPTSWVDLDHGDRIVYVGPEDPPAPFAAPSERAQPYRFLHTYHTGRPALEDKFGQKKYLDDAHPATLPANWRVATEEEVGA